MGTHELKTNTPAIIAVGPFLDKGDGVTLETGLTISNEKITLIAMTDDGNAPTLILDNVTGATSGTDNDLNYITNNDAGMMQIELSAANLNRYGKMVLIITDAANHVPVFEYINVVSAQYWDAKYGTGNFSSDVKAILGTVLTETAGQISAGFKKFFNVATPIMTMESVNQTGDAYSRLGSPAGASVSADVAAVKTDTSNIKTRTDGLPAIVYP